jgi:hypothetical protein
MFMPSEQVLNPTKEPKEPKPVQKFTQRLTLKNAKKLWGHLEHVPSKPKMGRTVRVVCEYQPRGNLAKVNGLEGKTVRLTGSRWIEVDMEIDGAIYTYRTTPNNLRYSSSSSASTSDSA